MDNLGLVDAERFIMLIQKESFDYTEWQKDLLEDISAEELNRRAIEFCRSDQGERNVARKTTTLRKKKEFA